MTDINSNYDIKNEKISLLDVLIDGPAIKLLGSLLTKDMSEYLKHQVNEMCVASQNLQRLPISQITVGTVAVAQMYTKPNSCFCRVQIIGNKNWSFGMISVLIIDEYKWNVDLPILNLFTAPPGVSNLPLSSESFYLADVTPRDTHTWSQNSHDFLQSQLVGKTVHGTAYRKQDKIALFRLYGPNDQGLLADYMVQCGMAIITPSFQGLFPYSSPNSSKYIENSFLYAPEHCPSPLQPQACSYSLAPVQYSRTQENDVSNSLLSSDKRKNEYLSDDIDETYCHFNHPVLRSGFRDTCKVTLIENGPWKFLVKLKSHQHFESSLTEHIQAFASGSLKSVGSVENGQAVMCKVSDMYYRAIIIGTEDYKKCGENIKVFLIDFGLDKNIDINNIFPVTPQLCEPPMLVSRCCLHGLPKSPNSQISKNFNGIVGVGKDLLFLINDESSGLLLNVDLEFRNYSVRDLITFNIFKRETMNSGDEVVVSFINEDGIAYLQLVRNMEKIDSLQSEVYNESKSSKILTTLVKGMPCLAIYSVDLNWYRGIIVDTLYGAKTVRFVDYGNEEEHTKPQNFKEIKDSLLNTLSAQAIPCILQGLEDKQFNSSEILQILGGKTYVVTVVKEIKCSLNGIPVMLPQVKLRDIKRQKFVNDDLMFSLEKSSPRTRRQTVHFAEEVSVCSLASVSDAGECQSDERERTLNEVPIVPDWLKVCRVTCVESPYLFYVNLIQNETIKRTINEVLKNSFTMVRPCEYINIGDHVMVASVNSAEYYYRAVILALTRDSCTSKLVDIGKKQTNTINQVKPLPREASLERYPPQAVKCGLESLSSTKPQIDFENFLTKEPVNIHFIRKDGDTWKVTILTTSDMMADVCRGGFNETRSSNFQKSGSDGKRERPNWRGKDNDSRGDALPWRSNHREYERSPRKATRINQGNEVWRPWNKRNSLSPRDDVDWRDTRSPDVVDSREKIQGITSAVRNLNEEAWNDSVSDLPPVQDKLEKELVEQPRLDSTETVFVTFVDQDSNVVWVQRKSDTDVLNNLNNDIENEIQKTAEQFTYTVSVGNLCLVQSVEDDQWYRARVVAAGDGGDMIQVHYIDFGNSETVQKSRVRELPITLCQPHQLGYACVAPDENLDLIASSTEEEIPLTVLSKEEEKFFVRFMFLCKDNDEKADLDKGNLELDTVGNPEPVDSPSNEAESSVNKEADCKVQVIGDVEVPLGVPVSLFISYIEDDGTLWVQRSDNSSAIEELMETLASLVEYKDNLIDFQMGTFCSGKYSVDEGWYRAKIEAIDNEKLECKVKFIDYGNTEILPFIDIKELPEECYGIPAQGIHCSLLSEEHKCLLKGSEIKNSLEKYNEMDIEGVFEFSDNMEIILKNAAVGGESLESKILSEVGLAISFNDGGFYRYHTQFVSSGNEMQNLAYIRNECVHNSQSVIISEIPNYQLAIIGEKDISNSQPAICETEVPSLQHASENPEVTQFQPAISTTEVSHSQSTINEPEVPDSEPVICEPEIPDSEPVICEPEIPDSEPVICEPEIPDSEPIICEAEISDSQPDTSSETEVSDSQPVICEPEIPDSEPVICEPEIPDSEPVICEAEISDSQPDTSNETEVVMTSEKKNFFIAFVEKDGNVWIQEYLQIPMLDMLMEQMKLHLQEEKGRFLLDPKEGDLCICKSLQDEKVYRAKVLKVRENSVQVHYIDYGNTEEVPLSSYLYAASEEFTALPVQAIFCSLEALEECDTETKVAMANSLCLFSVKGRLKMVENKNILVDAFVGEEPLHSLKINFQNDFRFTAESSGDQRNNSGANDDILDFTTSKLLHHGDNETETEKIDENFDENCTLTDTPDDFEALKEDTNFSEVQMTHKTVHISFNSDIVDEDPDFVIEHSECLDRMDSDVNVPAETSVDRKIEDSLEDLKDTTLSLEDNVQYINQETEITQMNSIELVLNIDDDYSEEDKCILNVTCEFDDVNNNVVNRSNENPPIDITGDSADIAITIDELIEDERDNHRKYLQDEDEGTKHSDMLSISTELMTESDVDIEDDLIDCQEVVTESAVAEINENRLVNPVSNYEESNAKKVNESLVKTINESDISTCESDIESVSTELGDVSSIINMSEASETNVGSKDNTDFNSDVECEVGNTEEENSLAGVIPKEENSLAGVIPKEENSLTGVIPKEENSLTGVIPKEENSLTGVIPKEENPETGVIPKEENSLAGVIPKVENPETEDTDEQRDSVEDSVFTRDVEKYADEANIMDKENSSNLSYENADVFNVLNEDNQELTNTNNDSSLPPEEDIMDEVYGTEYTEEQNLVTADCYGVPLFKEPCTEREALPSEVSLDLVMEDIFGDLSVPSETYIEKDDLIDKENKEILCKYSIFNEKVSVESGKKGDNTTGFDQIVLDGKGKLIDEDTRPIIRRYSSNYGAEPSNENVNITDNEFDEQNVIVEDIPVGAIVPDEKEHSEDKNIWCEECLDASDATVSNDMLEEGHNEGSVNHVDLLVTNFDSSKMTDSCKNVIPFVTASEDTIETGEKKLKGYSVEYKLEEIDNNSMKYDLPNFGAECPDDQEVIQDLTASLPPACGRGWQRDFTWDDDDNSFRMNEIACASSSDDDETYTDENVSPAVDVEVKNADVEENNLADHAVKNSYQEHDESAESILSAMVVMNSEYKANIIGKNLFTASTTVSESSSTNRSLCMAFKNPVKEDSFSVVGFKRSTNTKENSFYVDTIYEVDHVIDQVVEDEEKLCAFSDQVFLIASSGENTGPSSDQISLSSSSGDKTDPSSEQVFMTASSEGNAGPSSDQIFLSVSSEEDVFLAEPGEECELYEALVSISDSFYEFKSDNEEAEKLLATALTSKDENNLSFEQKLAADKCEVDTSAAEYFYGFDDSDIKEAETLLGTVLTNKVDDTVSFEQTLEVNTSAAEYFYGFYDPSDAEEAKTLLATDLIKKLDNNPPFEQTLTSDNFEGDRNIAESLNGFDGLNDTFEVGESTLESYGFDNPSDIKIAESLLATAPNDKDRNVSSERKHVPDTAEGDSLTLNPKEECWINDALLCTSDSISGFDNRNKIIEAELLLATLNYKSTTFNDTSSVIIVGNDSVAFSACVPKTNAKTEREIGCNVDTQSLDIKNITKHKSPSKLISKNRGEVIHEDKAPVRKPRMRNISDSSIKLESEKSFFEISNEIDTKQSVIRGNVFDRLQEDLEKLSKPFGSQDAADLEETISLGKIVHVDGSPLCIWIQDEEHSPNVNKIRSEMQSIIDEGLMVQTDIAPGHIYASYYGGELLRARVTSVNEDTVEIMFIDIGKRCCASLDDLYYCPHFLLSIPPLAQAYHLPVHIKEENIPKAVSIIKNRCFNQVCAYADITSFLRSGKTQSRHAIISTRNMGSISNYLVAKELGVHYSYAEILHTDLMIELQKSTQLVLEEIKS